MSEYTVVQMNYPHEMEYMVVLGRGVVCKNISDEAEANYIANALNEQTEEIATLKAALNASNAALAEAKKLIRDIASRDLDISEGYRHVSYNAIVIEAKNLVASWDSAVAATTQNAPKQSLGDYMRNTRNPFESE